MQLEFKEPEKKHSLTKLEQVSCVILQSFISNPDLFDSQPFAKLSEQSIKLAKIHLMKLDAARRPEAQIKAGWRNW